VLHQGKIAEMATGEGKIARRDAALYLTHAWRVECAHLVPVNNYLGAGATRSGWVICSNGSA